MIGKEDINTEEQPELTITDRRKFNVDGSLREGVEIAPEKPKAAPEPIDESSARLVPHVKSEPAAEAEVEEMIDDGEIPGADDPASFVNFLTTLASQAAAALGAMPHPSTGQRTLDLETGKYWIDVLAMLKGKTQNNLHPTEQKLFDGILGDLQMQYVQIQQMAEERLKQQAAQKFSAQDILGKK
ncbi:MAG: DUF1844 domain-containing protein [Pyrinomonadaceae bacterium]|nr:DUF1844 domain-containing protein [Pyrinomonadaceae bacterium]